jgi:hypothetical protein
MSELLTAIDAYMKSNGKGTKYLAKKMGDFFESDESPFNVKDGVVKKLTQNIDKFSSKIEKISKNIEYAFSGKNTLNSLNAFFTKLQSNFSSTFTRHKKEEGGEYRVHAIDVNLVHIKDSVYDTFFQHFQKRFSSESVLSKPDVSGHSHRIHSMDVNVKTMDKSLLETIKKGLTNVVIENNDKEKGGVLSSILGFITSGLTMFAGLAGISYLIEKTELGKTIKQTIRKIGSAISGWAGELLESGKIQRVFRLIGHTFSKIFDYLITGTTNFLITHKKSITQLMDDAISGTFNVITKFFKTTFSFFGLKERLGDEGSGIATILTKGIFKSITSLILGIGNKLTGKIFGKVMGGLDNLLGYIPKLMANFFEKSGESLLKGMAGSKILQKFKPTNFLKILTGSGLKFGAKLLKVIKFVPLIGTIISFYSAHDRFKKNDVFGGVLDIASGIATLFPGIGTAISVGLDVFNAFLDYKQKGGQTKGQMISDFFSPLTKWLGTKLSAENLKKVPVIGGLMRMYDAGKQFMDGDISGGLKSLMNAIGWFTPLPYLGGLLGLIDTLDGGKTSSAIPDANKQMLNPDKFVENLVSYAGGFFKSILDNLKNIFESASSKLTSHGTEIGDWFADKLGISDKFPATKDAVVVQPHSKDQILMAKNGGPFDLALKKMIEKMDEEIQILSHGFTILAEATLMGSNNVTNAVVATAGAASGGTQQSNRNPGADFRAKALDRLRR